MHELVQAPARSDSRCHIEPVGIALPAGGPPGAQAGRVSGAPGTPVAGPLRH